MPSSPPTLRRLSPDEQELYIGLSLAYLARLSQEQLALLLTISQRTIRHRLGHQSPFGMLQRRALIRRSALLVANWLIRSACSSSF